MNVLDFVMQLWSTYGPIINTLFWAVALGGLIGIERQWRQRLAGVRTNALVSVGAAAFTLFAAMLPNPGVDSVARVAAQVVSGIGFLGAGVIMRDGFTVHGLTTAATLWCAAAVGVLVGADMLGFAVICASLVLAVNLLLRPVSRAIDAKARRSDTKDVYVVTVTCEILAEKEVKKSLNQLVDLLKLNWVSVSTRANSDRKMEVIAKIVGVDHVDPQGHNIMTSLSGVDGVVSVGISTEKSP